MTLRPPTCHYSTPRRPETTLLNGLPWPALMTSLSHQRTGYTATSSPLPRISYLTRHNPALLALFCGLLHRSASPHPPPGSQRCCDVASNPPVSLRNFSLGSPSDLAPPPPWPPPAFSRKTGCPMVAGARRRSPPATSVPNPPTSSDLPSISRPPFAHPLRCHQRRFLGILGKWVRRATASEGGSDHRSADLGDGWSLSDLDGTERGVRL